MKMKKILFVGLSLSLGLMADLKADTCKKYLVKADELIASSEDTIMGLKQSRRATRATMYLLRYQICVKDRDHTKDK